MKKKVQKSKTSKRGQTLAQARSEISRLQAQLKQAKATPKSEPAKKVFAAQKKERAYLSHATKALRKFKPTKKDKGSYHFIGPNGQRNRAATGKKGVLVYIDRKGKKHLAKQPETRSHPYGYSPRSFADTQVPLQKTKLAEAKRFQDTKRKSKEPPLTKDQTKLAAKLIRRKKYLGQLRRKETLTKKEREELSLVARYDRWKVKEFQAQSDSAPVSVGYIASGREMSTGPGKYDFNDKVVKALTKDLAKAIAGERSHRQFVVRTKALVRTPDGEQVLDFSVDISKHDHDSIKVAGIEHFVRQKFYAFMARELSFLGYVTSGSANHIRSLAVNQGRESDEWIGTDGMAWRGREEYENGQIAKVLVFEWKIEKAI